MPVEKIRLIRTGNIWSIHLPGYVQDGGAASDLHISEESNHLLNSLSANNHAFWLEADLFPFDDADELMLMQPATPSVGGGYYMAKTLHGQVCNKVFWVKDIFLFLFHDLPQVVYLRSLSTP